MNINVKIDLRQLEKAVKNEPIVALQEINNAIKKSALKIQSLSQKLSPVNTGALRQSIHSRFEPLKGVVEAKAKYAIYVHEGTRPHDILPVNKMALANVRKGQFFGKRVKHPGTTANPFMKKSVEEAVQWINKYFIDAVNNIIKRI